MWHTDSSYRPTPSVGSLLHGIEISRTGGITQFINMYMVYDELPDSLRRQVEGRKARHDFGMLARLAGRAAADAGGTGGDAAGLASAWCGAIPSPDGSRSISARSTTMRSKGWTRAPRAA